LALLRHFEGLWKPFRNADNASKALSLANSTLTAKLVRFPLSLTFATTQQGSLVTTHTFHPLVVSKLMAAGAC
jgi:hypothetical protein